MWHDIAWIAKVFKLLGQLFSIIRNFLWCRNWNPYKVIIPTFEFLDEIIKDDQMKVILQYIDFAKRHSNLYYMCILNVASVKLGHGSLRNLSGATVTQ